MAKIQVILLCAVTVGGPTFDKKGAIDGSTEKLLEPGTKVEFDENEADRLISLGAARLPVADAEPEPAPAPAPVPPTDPVEPPAA